jgi:hypothetical protein
MQGMKLYEDQDGVLLYPEPEKEQKNYSIFNMCASRIALYVEKNENGMTIMCHVTTKKKSRHIGLYALYNKGSNIPLAEFKELAVAVLAEAGYKIEDAQEGNMFDSNYFFNDLEKLEGIIEFKEGCFSLGPENYQEINKKFSKIRGSDKQ